MPGCPAPSRVVFTLCALAAAAATPDHSEEAASLASRLPGSRPRFEARAQDLVARMTVAEKISQLTMDAAAIPRLGVPAYDWWNECLHGVARAGVATVFPQAIGLAATFDEPLIREMAERSPTRPAPSITARPRGEARALPGLTFWSPNINIFRDPRWGRGQETYGEDPYLTAPPGSRLRPGLQGDDPKYYKVVATAKHYAVHSGPEPERHSFDARPRNATSTRPTWQPSAPRRGSPGGLGDGRYNRVNGESASASRRLLIDILRNQWGSTATWSLTAGPSRTSTPGTAVKTPEQAALWA